MEQEILKFISRFPDANWLNGNCYYFAIILKDRFPDGEIYYDVWNGHFIFKLEDTYYDWRGIVHDIGLPICWDTFEESYDKYQYKKIIENCIK